MRTTTLLVSCAAFMGAVSFGVAAQADDPKSAPAAAHDNGHKADDPNRMICKGQQVTGSAIPKAKICRTKREWDDLSEQARQTMDNHNSINPTQK